MKYEKSCGAVVFRRAGAIWNVLLIRHARSRHVSFPKGHIELGESEKQTAEREILEETGLHVCVDTRFRAQNRYMIRPNVQKLVVFFAAIATESALTPQLEEISEAMWLPIDEAAKRLSYERDRKILYAAHEHIVRTAE